MNVTGNLAHVETTRAVVNDHVGTGVADQERPGAVVDPQHSANTLDLGGPRTVFDGHIEVRRNGDLELHANATTPVEHAVIDIAPQAPGFTVLP